MRNNFISNIYIHEFDININLSQITVKYASILNFIPIL